MNTLTLGSLFAGIGGFDLGLERAGMKTAWQVEIDDDCNQVLERHWPNVKRYRDIREVHGVTAHTASHCRNLRPELEGYRWSIEAQQARLGGRGATEWLAKCLGCVEPVDLICGGFPCQPFSVAGKQRGKEDDRYLWPEMLRVIKELKPRWVVLENVAGLTSMGEQFGDVKVGNKTVVRTTESDSYNAVLTHQERMLLNSICKDLEEAGYEVADPFVIPACATGAPHRRDRVWIVAYSEDKGAVGRQRLKRNDPEEGSQWRDNRGGSCADIGRETFAHNDLDRRSRPRVHEGRRGKGQGEADACRSGEDAPDSKGIRLQGFGPEGEQVAEAYGGQGVSHGSSSNQGVGSVESGMGRGSYDVSPWMDGSWEEGIPRVAKGVKDRTARLKALGNAVVPQIPEIIGRAIMEIEK